MKLPKLCTVSFVLSIIGFSVYYINWQEFQKTKLSSFSRSDKIIDATVLTDRQEEAYEKDGFVGKSGKPIMHTFFESTPGGCCMVSQQAHLDLLRQWEEAWQEAGWETRVLTVADAQRNPDLDKLRNAILDLEVNEYNQFCFYRWFAMAATGGGWMSDYDTFPLNIDLKEGLTLPNNGRFTAYENNVPCLLSGSKSEWIRMSNLLAETLPIHKEGPPTDMYVLRSARWNDGEAAIFLPPREAVFQGFVYQEDGGVDCDALKTVKAMHFSHDSIGYAFDHDLYPLKDVEGLQQQLENRGKAGRYFINRYKEECNSNS